MLGPNLVLSDAHGVFIPQLFCSDIDEEWAQKAGIDWEDVTICQSGPDHEWYWEAWQAILDDAALTNNGVTWRLYQDGDLWEYPEGYEWPDC